MYLKWRFDKIIETVFIHVIRSRLVALWCQTIYNIWNSVEMKMHDDWQLRYKSVLTNQLELLSTSWLTNWLNYLFFDSELQHIYIIFWFISVTFWLWKYAWFNLINAFRLYKLQIILLNKRPFIKFYLCTIA